MATVLITGGTGLIGEALTIALLSRGDTVLVLTRTKDKKSTHANLRYLHWDVSAQTIETKAIEQADAIVHLAGANVAGHRWTAKYKQEIVASRVQSSALLVTSLRNVPNKVRVVVSASAIGWYGPDPQIPNPQPFHEGDPSATDFLGQVCVQWEQSIQPVTSLGIRLVLLRTGLVLSNRGGAYAEFKKPLRAGIASVLGSGTQVISWIHITDVVNQYIRAIDDEKFSGVYNAVAPQPVSNKTLIQAIAREKGGAHITVPVPAFALKLALGEMSIEVLKSATVSSKRMEATGYTFSFPHITGAVHDLMKNAS